MALKSIHLPVSSSSLVSAAPCDHFDGFTLPAANQDGTDQDQPRYMLILLHGWGADAQDLAGLFPLMQPDLPNFDFLAVNAPEICSMNPAGRQWFELSFTPDETGFGMQVDRRAVPEAAKKTRALIHLIVSSASAAFNIPVSYIVLGGFSQGGMMTLAAGLSTAERPAGLACLSGGLPTADDYQAAGDAPLPILLTHGARDEVVPIEACHDAAEKLTALGYAPDVLHSPQTGHGIDEAMLGRLVSFCQHIAA